MNWADFIIAIKRCLIPSKQEVTVNMLNPTLATTASNGVTCTNNGDGTYTINGTASADTSFKLCTLSFKKGTYKWLGCPDGGSADTYYMSGTAVPLTYDTGGTVYNYATNRDAVVLFTVKSGVTVNNIVIKPMLTTNINTTWEDFVPYTGNTGQLNGDVAGVRKEYLPKSGGTFDAGADLYEKYQNKSWDARWYGFKNNDDTVFGGFGSYSEGGVGQFVFMGANGTESFKAAQGLCIWPNEIKWKQKHVLHEGNMASHVLPLTGGTLTDVLRFAKVSNGNGYLQKNHTADTDNGFYVVDTSKDGKLARLEVSAKNQKAYFTGDDRVLKELLHTGNSVKTVISDTAPSDTSALWIDTSE